MAPSNILSESEQRQLAVIFYFAYQKKKLPNPDVNELGCVHSIYLSRGPDSRGVN